jgi:hypothetical protein
MIRATQAAASPQNRFINTNHNDSPSEPLISFHLPHPSHIFCRRARREIITTAYPQVPEPTTPKPRRTAIPATHHARRPRVRKASLRVVRSVTCAVLNHAYGNPSKPQTKRCSGVCVSSAVPRLVYKQSGAGRSPLPLLSQHLRPSPACISSHPPSRSSPPSLLRDVYSPTLSIPDTRPVGLRTLCTAQRSARFHARSQQCESLLRPPADG